MHSGLADTPCEIPVLWPRQPAIEAVVIGPFGIECLGVGVCVQFKKIFGHILICIFGFLSGLVFCLGCSSSECT